MKSIPTLLLVLVLGIAPVIGCRRGADETRESYLKAGRQYLAEKKYPEAVIEFRNAVNIDPRSGEARIALADAYEKTGDLPGAFAETVRAADLLPDQADIQVRAARMMLFAGQYEDARTRAEKVLAKDPRHVQAQVALSNALAGLKDFDGAVKEIKEAIQLEPEEGRSYANLGVIELARGRNADAEAAFRRAVALAPNNPMPHLALANFLWSTGRRADAEAELRAAANLDPNNLDVNQALGLFLMATGQANTAEQYFKAAAKSGEPGRQLLLAEYYLATGRRDSALPILETLSKDSPARVDATLRLAAIRFSENKRKEALELVESILRAEGRNSAALSQRARFLLSERRLDEALADATAATQAAPGAAEPLYLVGLIQTQRRELDAAIKAFNEVLQLNPRAGAAQVQLAQLHLVTGRTEPSVQMAQQAVQSLPRSVEARLVYVRTLIASKDFQKAQQELAILLKGASKVPEVHVAAGQLRLAQNDMSGARAEFEAALSLDPFSPGALDHLANMERRAGDKAKAQRRIEEALAGRPTDIRILIVAGSFFARDKQFQRAEDLFKKAMIEDPNALEAYSALARLYLLQQKLEPARLEFEALAKRHARPTVPATMAAMILQMQGRDAEAKARYQQVVHLDPNAGVASNNLAWYMVLQGENLDEALRLAQAAKAQLPGNADVDDTLGWIYYKKGLPEMAIPPLQLSVNKDPKNPSYLYHLGMAQYRAGRFAEGRESLRRALEVKADHPHVEEIRNTLSAINERVGTQ